MKTVAIFRNQLFKNSESFITNQADSIKKFKCVYVGRKVLNKTNRDNVISLESVVSSNVRTKEFWNAIFRDSYAYSLLLKNTQIDIIHAHFAIDSLYGLSIAKKLNIPIITTLHGFDVTTKKLDLIKSLSPAWINYCFFSSKLKEHGDMFLCVSDFIKEKALSAGFPESKLKTHYIGIDVENITPIADAERDKSILHIARLVEKKGTLTIISAVGLIKDHLNGYKIKIIGDGPLYQKIKDKINEMQLNEHIELMGEVKHHEVMQMISSTSMLLVPSVTAKNGDSEGLPTVILEASANKVPVIGTLHAGIPEAIIDGETGFLVEEHDAKMLQKKFNI